MTTRTEQPSGPEPGRPASGDARCRDRGRPGTTAPHPCRTSPAHPCPTCRSLRSHRHALWGGRVLPMITEPFRNVIVARAGRAATVRTPPRARHDSRHWGDSMEQPTSTCVIQAISWIRAARVFRTSGETGSGSDRGVSPTALSVTARRRLTVNRDYDTSLHRSPRSPRLRRGGAGQQRMMMLNMTPITTRYGPVNKGFTPRMIRDLEPSVASPIRSSRVWNRARRLSSSRSRPSCPR